MIYCINCAHCGPLNFAAGSDITHCERNGIQRPGTSPVTGKPFQEPTELYAEVERTSDRENCCGPDARFFKPRLAVA